MAGTSLVALIDKSEFPDEIKQRLSSVVENAVGLHIENMTKAEAEIIANASELAEMYPDYRDNPHGRRLFDAILLWLIQFLYNRLEMTRADDPTVAYLFQRDDSTLPSEDLLQEDFFRWLSTNVAGSGLEATMSAVVEQISSSDPATNGLSLKSSGSCPTPALKRSRRSYQAQATDYQNVSVRVGILFVLDLVNTNNEALRT